MHPRTFMRRIMQVAEHCLKSAKDLSGLLLLYSARGSAGGLATLTSAALEGGKNNVAFGACSDPASVNFRSCCGQSASYSPDPRTHDSAMHCSPWLTAMQAGMAHDGANSRQRAIKTARP